MMDYIAYCGLLCSECPVYIATKTNDTAMKITLASEYSNEHCSFAPEDMECEGCLSPKTDPCKVIEEYVKKGCDSRIRLDKIAESQQAKP